ncbi:hypothetical protein BDZ94DRAFT_1326390 [Collybia nuda]|uniref:Uncharacterized protein n=1 Tax=Collybia nuda TaxID=64659 RepID=A0A9P6CCM1_9AGAR|nr:hypothetical protein BDZ94DRAFT_1326390 [Collybia nuda]
MDQVEHGVQFLGMLNYINLATKMESIKKGMSHSTQISVLRSHPAFKKFSPEKIQRWLSEGHKYASLARGGSLYILYLTCVVGKKSAIARLSGDLVPDLVRNLCAPSGADNLGRLVLDKIIPAIATLMKQVQFKFPTMFSEEMQNALGIQSEIDSGDLDASDRFFDSIKENTVYTPRCRKAWAPCLDWDGQTFPSYSLFPANHHHLTSSSSQPSLCPASPLSDIEENDPQDPPPEVWESVSLKGLGTVKISGLSTINTSFDPNLEVNKAYPRTLRDPEANFEFTSQHRAWAKDAYEPQNLQDLRNKLGSQLRKGYKLSPDKYIKVPSWLFQKWMLRINDIHGVWPYLLACWII